MSCRQIVRLIRAANKTADVLLPRNPFRMAVAKNNVAAINPVIIACIRKILVGPILAPSVIGIVDVPNI